jgi:hypothetical protein
VPVDESRISARSAAWSLDIRRRSFCLLGRPRTASRSRGSCCESTHVIVKRELPSDALLAPRAGHGHRDRVGGWLSDDTDWDEPRNLVAETYRLLASKNLAVLTRPNSEIPSRARLISVASTKLRQLPSASSAPIGLLLVVAVGRKRKPGSRARSGDEGAAAQGMHKRLSRTCARVALACQADRMEPLGTPTIALAAVAQGRATGSVTGR